MNTYKMRMTARGLLGLTASLGSAVCLLTAEAADLVVEESESVTLDAATTYETVTVHGTLTVPKGIKLTVTGSCYVDGTLHNLGTFTSSAGTVYVGYEGRAGTLIQEGSFSSRYAYVGSGDADGCLVRLVGASHALGVREIVKYGSGAARIEFSGGQINFGLSAAVVEGGDLTLASMGGNDIMLKGTMSNTQPIFRSDSGNGRLFTAGTGSVRVMTDARVEGLSKACIQLAFPSQGLTWGHGGGFKLAGKSGAESLFELTEDGFFLTNGLPSALSLATGAILRANGKTVCFERLAGSGFLRNGVFRLGGSGADWCLTNDLCFSENALVQKVGTETLTLGTNVALTNLVVWGGALSTPVDPGSTCVYGSVMVTGGTFRVANRSQVASFRQSGAGVVSVDAGCCLRLADGCWSDPAFAMDTAGRVESAATNPQTNLFYLSSGTGIVQSAFAAVSGTTRFLKQGTSARLFRFTIKKAEKASSTVQLSRLQLFDAAGNNLALGLAAADPGTDPASLEPGTCAYAGNYSQGSGSAVQNLFDGLTTTKMYLTGLVMNLTPEENTQRIIHFRLPASATAVAMSYQLTSANDATPTRNPSIWTLEGSSDGGVTWELFDSRDERVSGDVVTTTSTYSDFNNGVPFNLRAAVAPVSALEFRKSVSVAAGATLDVGTDPAVCKISALAVDLDEGAGTLTSFTPAENGTLDLASSTDPTVPLELPLTVGSLGSAGNLNSWTVSVNGTPRSNRLIRFLRGKLTLVPSGFAIVVR